MTPHHAVSPRPKLGLSSALALALLPLALVPLPSASAQDKSVDTSLALAVKTLSKEDALQVQELDHAIIARRRTLKYEETVPLARRILEIRTRAQGPEHWETADARAQVETLQRIAALGSKERAEVNTTYDQIDEAHQLFTREKFADCLRLLKQALDVRRKRLGADARETVACMNNLAMVLGSLGNYREAQTYYEQAADGLRRSLGENHPGLATSYSNLALNLQELHRLQEALTYQEKALAITLRTVGPEARETAQVRNNLGMLLDALGRHAEARPHYEKALSIALRGQGEKSLEAIRVRSNLAANSMYLADYGGAESTFRLVLDSCRALFPAGNTEIATVAMNLANVLDQQGKFAEAESLLREALAILERILSRSHPDTVSCLNNLAANLSGQGRLAEAEPLYREALSITLSRVGERDTRVARLDNNLAHVLANLGRDEEAERLLRQAVELWTKLSGEHEETANALNNLGMLLVDRARFDDAEPLLRRALEMRRKLLGPTNPGTAQSLNNLGGLFESRGRWTEAERYYREAQEIRLKLDRSGLDTAESFNNLAATLRAPAQLEEKERLDRAALAIRERRLTREHPLTGQSYNNLGNALYARGKFAEAEEVWKTAAAIFETARLRVGNSGLDRVEWSVERSPLLRLASLLAGSGKPAAAWPYWEANLARGLLDDLSTRQLRPLTADQRRRESNLLGQLQKLDEQIGKLVAKDRRIPDEDQRLDHLRQRQSILRGQFVALENELNAQYREFAGKPATLDEIRDALPADVALLGWLDLQLMGPPDRDRSPCHWACVVRRDGDPHWVPTPGTGAERAWTKEDDQRPRSLRDALRNHKPAWSDLAAALAKQRLEPLQPHLKGITRLIVLPAPALAGVPIDVLIAAQPADAPRPTVSYAPSATMFARLSRPRTGPAGPARLLALGDPAFPRPEPGTTPPPPPDHGIALRAVQPNGNADRAGLRAGDVLLQYNGTDLKAADDLKIVPAEAGARSIPVRYWRRGDVRNVAVAAGTLGIQHQPGREAADVVLAQRAAVEVLKSLTRGATLKRLPGTRREVEAIAALFPKDRVTTLLGAQATESALQELARKGELKTYRFLHLATHGKANPHVAMSTALFLAPDPDRSAGPTALDTDGQITAQQIVNTWDLDADLVVLSACQSGLGRYAGGEGYLGFTQALFVKGARTVVLTQWDVNDRATSLLIRRFYQNLLGKRPDLTRPMPKSEALAEAKTWLRGLDAAEAEQALDDAGLTRGERNVKTAPAANSVRPFEHPYYWSAFVLVGDPN